MRIGLLLTGLASLCAIAAANFAEHRPDSGTQTASIIVVPGIAPEHHALPVQNALPTFAVALQTADVAPASVMAASATWWRPAVADTWQWQISGPVNSRYDVKIYDVDLYDVPNATIRQLHASGRKIVCYFSAGSSETWRSDFKNFAASDLGSALDGWQGERWLNTRSQNVRRIMKRRLEFAVRRGCDGVEPDNVDGYANRNGLGLTAEDQLAYNQFLATEAHRRGLAIGLKNDLDQIPALVNSFDFAVNEQCNQYRECAALRPFVAAGKPVFNAEYQARYRDNVGGARDMLCSASRLSNIRTLILPLALNDKSRFSCDGSTI